MNYKSMITYSKILQILIFLCFFSYELRAQVKTINGRVSDDNGNGLPGVNVVIKGTTIGVTTDADGYYILANVNKGDVLVFTYIGFKDKQIRVQDNNIINVTISVDTYVWNGTNAKPGDAPWQVLLQRSDLSINKNFCGGAIINASWIITACHCTFADENFKKPFDHSQISIYAGSIILSELGKAQVRSVKRILRHPKWGRNRTSAHDNDIALIQLEEPLNIVPNVVEKIDFAFALNQADAFPKPGTQARVFGWGRMESGEQPDTLQVGDVTIKDLSEAKNQYKGHKRDRVTGNMLAASAPKVDACTGDSGGPLVVEYEGQSILVGLVSYGEGCANASYFGIYTKVENYNKWIAESIVSPN